MGWPLIFLAGVAAAALADGDDGGSNFDGAGELTGGTPLPLDAVVLPGAAPQFSELFKGLVSIEAGGSAGDKLLQQKVAYLGDGEVSFYVGVCMASDKLPDGGGPSLHETGGGIWRITGNADAWDKSKHAGWVCPNEMRSPAPGTEGLTNTVVSSKLLASMSFYQSQRNLYVRWAVGGPHRRFFRLRAEARQAAW